MELRWIYITTPNLQEAKTIGTSLVESRLAACVNIIETMHSIYYWEDRLQNDTETVLIAKTTDRNVPDLIKKVKALHSYECPCIVSLTITEGDAPFLRWIQDQVG